jgi:acetylglutamate kinase
MAVTTIVKQGAFTADIAKQINDNFTSLSGTSAGGALTDGHILVGSALGVSTDVAMSGDVTIVNSGATTIKTSVSLTTPVLGVASGTSVNLSGDCKAATFHSGATAGVTAGPFATVSSIASTAGLVTTLTGSA